jgi:hypothetical protein
MPPPARDGYSACVSKRHHRPIRFHRQASNHWGAMAGCLNDAGVCMPRSKAPAPMPHAPTTAAPSLSATAQACRVEHLARHADAPGSTLTLAPMRRVVLLAGEFRAQCQSRATAAQLAEVLKAAIPCAHCAFDVYSHRQLGPQGLGFENERCLADLGALVQALNADVAPPLQELEHALDALLVQLVRIESEFVGPEPMPLALSSAIS